MKYCHRQEKFKYPENYVYSLEPIVSKIVEKYYNPDLLTSNINITGKRIIYECVFMADLTEVFELAEKLRLQNQVHWEYPKEIELQ